MRYPTNREGFPVPVSELELPEEWNGGRDNHHLAYCRKTFSRLAIGQAFRDLEGFQEVIPRRKHEYIHKLYQGIELPHPYEMLDRVEQAHDTDERLKIYQQGSGYEMFHLTDEHMKRLHDEYTTIRHKI